MAASPAFWANRRFGRAVLSAATTDKTGATTTNIIDMITGVAAGTEITEINVKADGDPVDCIILIFVHNGTDYRLYDEIDIGNPAAGSTTVAAYGPDFHYYTGLFLPTASFKVAAAITVVPTAGSVNVFASGGDLTQFLI